MPLLSPVLIIFYPIAALILLQGCVSVIEGVRYRRYVRAELGHTISDFNWPRITLIVPCKGADHDLEGNLEALVNQEPAASEIIFVTAEEKDTSRAAMMKVKSRHPHQRIEILAAGFSSERGEKVNNLMAAVEAADPASEIFAFADSDAQTPPAWLKNLVAPLCGISPPGATTGYRWYLPAPGNFPSLLRSAWNAGIATLLGPHDRNFCWGGSMAIRCDTFETIHVRRYWNHSISDDYSLTNALRDTALTIRYVPQCLIPSFGPAHWSEVVDWSVRQLMVTRIYSRKLWRLAAISQTLFSFVVIAGVGLVAREWFHSGFKPVSCILSLVLILGFVRGFTRWLSVREILSRHKENLIRYAWAYILLPPLVSLFSTYVLWRSAFARRMEWRGRVYELVSPDEVSVIR